MVFVRESFDSATMSRIAAEAGVSVGTLYLYFKDKEELRRAVTESRADMLLSAAKLWYGDIQTSPTNP